MCVILYLLIFSYTESNPPPISIEQNIQGRNVLIGDGNTVVEAGGAMSHCYEEGRLDLIIIHSKHDH